MSRPSLTWCDQRFLASVLCCCGLWVTVDCLPDFRKVDLHGFLTWKQLLWIYDKRKLGKQCGGKHLWRFYYKKLFVKVKGETRSRTNEQGIRKETMQACASKGDPKEPASLCMCAGQATKVPDQIQILCFFPFLCFLPTLFLSTDVSQDFIYGESALTLSIMFLKCWDVCLSVQPTDFRSHSCFDQASCGIYGACH